MYIFSFLVFKVKRNWLDPSSLLFAWLLNYIQCLSRGNEWDFNIYVQCSRVWALWQRSFRQLLMPLSAPSETFWWGHLASSSSSTGIMKSRAASQVPDPPSGSWTPPSRGLGLGRMGAVPVVVPVVVVGVGAARVLGRGHIRTRNWGMRPCPTFAGMFMQNLTILSLT